MNPDYLKFKGAVAAVPTPYKSREYDPESRRRLMKYQIDSGTSGVFIGGWTGEFPFVSLGDRKRDMDVVAEYRRDGFFVVAGISGTDLQKTKELGRHAEMLRLDAAVVAPKFETLVSADIIMHEIAEAIGLPLIIYDNLGAFGNIVTPVEMIRIYQDRDLSARIAAVKDSTEDVSLTNDRLYLKKMLAPWVQYFLGSETVMLDHPELEADGIVSGTASDRPKLVGRIWDSRERKVSDASNEDARTLRKRIETYSNGQMIPQIKTRLKEKRIFASDELAPRNLAELVR